MTPGPIPRRAVLVAVVLVAVLALLVVLVLGRSDGSSTASAPDPSSTVAPATTEPVPSVPDPPAPAPAPTSDPVDPGEPATTDPTPSASDGPAPVATEVEAAIAAEGSAPVLARLSVADGLAPEERADAVAAAADEVLATLPPDVAATAKPTGTTAVLALTVDAAGLDALRQAGVVTAVSEDGINRISSTNSTASIQAPQAWAQGADGTGTVIAVLDTGVARDHPYLTRDGVSDVLAEACFSSANGSQWSSYCPGGSTAGVFTVGAAAPCAAPVSECEHGTHVAGIAAGGTGATSLASGVGASGVAPDAELLAVQVFSRGLTSGVCGGAPPCAIAFDSDIIRGLEWVYAQRAAYPGLAAVNLSLGGGKYSGACDANPVKLAIDKLRDVRIATVVASGNNGWRGFVSSPACISSAVTVGAVDDATGQVASYSNQSFMVDLLGPGTAIRSSFPPNVMGNLSGTSMATPAVAGAFAVLKETRPTATVDQLESDLESTGQIMSLFGVGSWPYLKLNAPTSSALSGRPTVPLTVSGTPGPGQVEVSWAAPDSPGSSAVMGYTVTASPGGATCSTSGQLSCVVTGLTNGKAYRFAVRAENASGVGAATGTPPIVPFTAPAAPLSVAGFGGSGKAILSWAAPFDGGRPITGYTATASPGGATCTSTGALGCVVAGLDDGASYTFTVRATNLAGPGPASSPSAAVTPGPSSMVPLTPARLLDTRPGEVTFDGLPSGPRVKVGQTGTLDLQVKGRGIVPDGAGAVALNVTVINPTAESFLTVFPTGEARPTASNLNFVPGQTVPNMVIAKLGAGGKVSIYNQWGATDVFVDVMGWFPSGAGYAALTPARLLDTRPGEVTFDGLPSGPRAKLGQTRTLDLQVKGRGIVPDGAGAVALNVTVINPTAESFLTVFPTGEARPTASNLNFVPGQTVPNMVIAKLGAGGKVSIYNQWGATDVFVDVMGWFPSGAGYAALTPARLLDTRPGELTVDGLPSGPRVRVGQIETRQLAVAGRGGVPAVGASAVALNVTAVSPSTSSFITVWASGSSRPVASNLNLVPGRVTPNMVIAPIGPDGRIAIYNQWGSTDLIVDVVGWFP